MVMNINYSSCGICLSTLWDLFLKLILRIKASDLTYLEVCCMFSTRGSCSNRLNLFTPYSYVVCLYDFCIRIHKMFSVAKKELAVYETRFNLTKASVNGTRWILFNGDCDEYKSLNPS